MPACPECGARIAASSKVCPACDARQDGTAPKRKSGNSKSKKAKPSDGSTKALMYGIGLGGAVLAVGLVVALLPPSPRPGSNLQQTTNSEQPQENQTTSVEDNKKVVVERLKRIALATHSFHDVNRRFPPISIQSKVQEGEALQSWMTDLLPYLDDGALLHKTIDRKRPWTDPANAIPFQSVVQNYLNPGFSETKDSKGYAVAHYAANSRLISDEKNHWIGDITDGTSNTMLAGTVSEGFKAWGDPTNHRDAAKGFKGGAEAFGSPEKDFVFIVMADGAVRKISKNVDPDLCLKLAGPNDGQIINVNEFEAQ